jgi:Ca-activated chloride channel homolog
MKNRFDFWKNFICGFFLFALSISLVNAQAGRRSMTANDDTAAILPVVAVREKNPTEPVRMENVAFYENGVEQKIKGLSYDPSPARIVLLVDNSQTLRTDLTKLTNAAKEFAYEIFEGDQLFVAAYDEKAEIVQEWTDDAKKIEASLSTFRKKGNPFLFDALGDVLTQIIRPLLPGARKTAVVIISDGLDRGSKTNFDRILSELQTANVTIYALQIPDRTGGAYRRDAPKPEHVIQKLTEGTGGKAFEFDDPQTAAKAICDELRKNRYLLSYQPLAGGGVDARRLFMVADEGISIRMKKIEPPSIKLQN